MSNGTAGPGLRADGEPSSFALRPPSAADLARRSAVVLGVMPAAAIPLLTGGDPRKLSRRDIGVAVRTVAQRLGGTWVKVGQLLASAPGLVGEELSEELRPLLDTSPRVPMNRVKASITRALGRPVGELFRELDPDPVGTGSLAVVHRAVTRDGRTVAVKVLRPGIERDSSTDLVLIDALLGRLAAWRRMDGGAAKVLLAGLRAQLSDELDLRREAAHMARFRRLFADAGLSRVFVPEVETALTARRALTMEFIDGVPIDDLSAIEAMGGDAAPLVAEAVRAWWATVGVAGVFHGDVHAGNLIYTTDGRLALIDWGIVGNLSPENRRFMLALISGAAGQDGAWDEAARFLASNIPERVRRRETFDADRVHALIKQGLSYALTRPYGEVSLGALLSGEAFTDESGQPLPPRRRGDRQAARAESRPMRPLRRPRPTRNGGGRNASRDAAGRDAASRDAASRDAPSRNAAGRNAVGPDAESGSGLPDRDILLLGKQLLYFERYGKQYLGDRAVLNDAGFVLDLVNREGAASGKTGL